MNPRTSRGGANVPIHEPTWFKTENSLGTPPFSNGLAGTCIAHQSMRAAWHTRPGRLSSGRRFRSTWGVTCAAEPAPENAQRRVERSRPVVYQPEPTLTTTGPRQPPIRRVIPRRARSPVAQATARWSSPMPRRSTPHGIHDATTHRISAGSARDPGLHSRARAHLDYLPSIRDPATIHMRYVGHYSAATAGTGVAVPRLIPATSLPGCLT